MNDNKSNDWNNHKQRTSRAVAKVVMEEKGEIEMVKEVI